MWGKVFLSGWKWKLNVEKQFRFSGWKADLQRSQTGCLPYFHPWFGLSANLKCRSETCCTRLAENTGHKQSPKIRHLRIIAQLCLAISTQLSHLSTIGKNLLSSNISSTCPYKTLNFGLLAAEIGSLVWGTPATFKRFCVLAALRHGTLVVGVSQTLQRWTEGANRGRHLYSAGRPSRWALAHILFKC